jgi:hypothetical protein
MTKRAKSNCLDKRNIKKRKKWEQVRKQVVVEEEEKKEQENITRFFDCPRLLVLA